MKKKMANKVHYVPPHLLKQMRKLAIRPSKSNERAKRKSFNLLKEYKNSWNYVKDSEIFIYIIIGIFLFFIFLGFFIPSPQFIYDVIINYIKDLLAETENMSLSDIIPFIIFNNLQSTFFGILFGIFFGIFPIANAIINGYMLGFVSSISIANEGILTLWRLLPHGIFELPAVFISLGLGLKIGMFIFQKNKLKSLKNYLINSFKVFLLIIIPLLIIAGIIEGTLISLLK
jgi:stage II sporulation protein M